MPYHSTIATALDKHKISSTVAYIPLLEVSITDTTTGGVIETLYLASNNETFVWQGNTYTPVEFEIDVTFEQDKVPSVSLLFRDFLNVIQPRMQAYGGIMGSNVRFMIVNSSVQDNPPEFDENFRIISAKANASDYTIQFTMGAENPLELRWPPRLQYRDRCFWQYKGVECGYTGTNPSCDFTLNGPNGCQAHANALRFGGFPGIRVPTW
jgi:lambda family phage minor tail protein L